MSLGSRWPDWSWNSSSTLIHLLTFQPPAPTPAWSIRCSSPTTFGRPCLPEEIDASYQDHKHEPKLAYGLLYRFVAGQAVTLAYIDTFIVLATTMCVSPSAFNIILLISFFLSSAVPRWRERCRAGYSSSLRRRAVSQATCLWPRRRPLPICGDVCSRPSDKRPSPHPRALSGVARWPAVSCRTAWPIP